MTALYWRGLEKVFAKWNVAFVVLHQEETLLTHAISQKQGVVVILIAQQHPEWNMFVKRDVAFAVLLAHIHGNLPTVTAILNVQWIKLVNAIIAVLKILTHAVSNHVLRIMTALFLDRMQLVLK